MNRREAITRVGLLLGGTIVGMNLFLQGCKNEEDAKEVVFSDDDIRYLDEIADTILPETNTPGAKAAGVGPFMALMVKDCYTADDQRVFYTGLNGLKKDFYKKYKTDFLEASAEQRHEFLVALDEEQKEYMRNKKPEESAHYFRMMKELTLLGYFTSEVGATQALRYVETPGRYDGCIPYTKGDRAWAL